MSSKQIKNDSNPIIKEFVCANEKLTNSMSLTLYLKHQLELSHSTIKLINNQIVFLKHQILQLMESKPFWFQRKRIRIHYKEVELLENEIINCYKKIETEMEIIMNLKDALSNCILDNNIK